MRKQTTDKDMAAILVEALECGSEEEDFGFYEAVKNVITFKDAGVLTGNAGVVVKMADGSEFQITVVKSA